MKNHLVSIIIPSYNVESYLADACESALAQTYVNWEAIIVDDGSKDNTSKIAKTYCDKDERFVYIYQENKGLSGARKTGIDAAKGEFIQLLDADDALLPQRLEVMVNATFEVDDNVILYSDFWIGLNNTLKGKQVPSSRPHNIGRDLQFMDMYTGWRNTFLFVPACPFFRSSLFKTVSYDATLRSVEDWDLYLSILSKGKVFRAIQNKNILYRENPGGLSKNKSYIYTQLFYMLYKWKDTNKESSRIYSKTIANLYSEILIQHYWKKQTDRIKPEFLGNSFIFYFYTSSYVVKRLAKIINLGIKKRLKK